MKIEIDHRVEKWLKKQPQSEKYQVRSYLRLFSEFGFTLNQKYLKKIDNKLWEIRPGSIRLFLFQTQPNCVIIHAMHKKSQKITKETLLTIKQRIKEYI